MKKLNKVTKFIAASAFLGLGMTSCSLDMLPLNDVVLENFWTNKSDVQNVMNSCYVAMQEGGYINSLIVWGETRSDNAVVNPTDASEDLKNLMKGNIKTTNGCCNWASLYNVINRCNTILEYAPKVAAKDPNYTESDLRANIAEAQAIRAITYLYLIKTFQNVPLVLTPSVDDTQNYNVPATPFNRIIDVLISELEPVISYAPVKNIAAADCSSAQQSTGRITRPAVNAILAELYLWKASDATLSRASQKAAYEQCIKYCDNIIEFKNQQCASRTFGDGAEIDYDRKVYTDYGYYLLSEGLENTVTGNATSSIFFKGNSFESLFEISYMHSDREDYAKNTSVAVMYGGYPTKKDNDDGKVKHTIMANTEMLSTNELSDTYKDNNLFSVTSDVRGLYSFCPQGEEYYIRKYVAQATSADGKVGKDFSVTGSKEPTVTSWKDSYYSWIIYRLTEVMLFRAEAQIQLANLITLDANADDEAKSALFGLASATDAKKRVSGTSIVNGSYVLPVADPEDTTDPLVASPELCKAATLYADAFNLISAVYLRSNPFAATQPGKYAPVRADYKSFESFETLLMNERRREFLFEGKRYFDLVRQARRDGNTLRFRGALASKYGKSGAAVVRKMVMPEFMYMPYLKSQTEVNPSLIQNPAYADEAENAKK